MNKNKTHNEICDELYNFKNSFCNLFYLMKLFHFLYFEINEMELYPEKNEYIAKNCLFVLSDIINDLLDKNYKQIIILYEKIENINENNSYA